MHDVDELIDHIRELENKVLDIEPQPLRGSIKCNTEYSDSLHINRMGNQNLSLIMTVVSADCCGEEIETSVHLTPTTAKELIAALLYYLEENGQL